MTVFRKSAHYFHNIKNFDGRTVEIREYEECGQRVWGVKISENGLVRNSAKLIGGCEAKAKLSFASEESKLHFSRMCQEMMIESKRERDLTRKNMISTSAKKKVASLMFGIFFCVGLSFAQDQLNVKQGQENQEEVLRVFMPEEDWFLPIGYEIKATIQNAIFSFNLVTPVIATVDEPAICPKNNRVILPKKTKLIGNAEILKSDDRVNIRFYYAVLSNGREFTLNSIALSPDGSAGIKGTVKEYKDTRLMSSAMSGALLGVGQAVPLALAGQPIAAGAIGGALQQGAQQVGDISNQKADVSILVPPFQKALVFLSSRLVLAEKQKEEPKANKDLKEPAVKPRSNWRGE